MGSTRSAGGPPRPRRRHRVRAAHPRRVSPRTRLDLRTRAGGRVPGGPGRGSAAAGLGRESLRGLRISGLLVLPAPLLCRGLTPRVGAGLRRRRRHPAAGASHGGVGVDGARILPARVHGDGGRRAVFDPARGGRGPGRRLRLRPASVFAWRQAAAQRQRGVRRPVPRAPGPGGRAASRDTAARCLHSDIAGTEPRDSLAQSDRPCRREPGPRRRARRPPARTFPRDVGASRGCDCIRAGSDGVLLGSGDLPDVAGAESRPAGGKVRLPPPVSRLLRSLRLRSLLRHGTRDAGGVVGCRRRGVSPR